LHFFHLNKQQHCIAFKGSSRKHFPIVKKMFGRHCCLACLIYTCQNSLAPLDEGSEAAVKPLGQAKDYPIFTVKLKGSLTP
jgi:hypothetical protein